MFKKKPAPKQNRRRLSDADNTSRMRSPAFSYHAQRQLHEDGSRQRMRPDAEIKLGQRRFRTILNYVVTRVPLLVAVICGIVFLCWNSVVATDSPKVVLHGTTEQRLLLDESTKYAEKSQQILKNSLANRVKLTFSSTKFEAAFQKDFPEVAHAELQMPLIGQRSELHITPAPGVLQYTATSGEVGIIDNLGRVVSTSVHDTGDSFIRVQDQSGFKVTRGAQVLSSKDVEFILRLDHQLSAQNMKVASYTLVAASRQIQVRVNDWPYYVKFTFENDVLQQAGALVGIYKMLEAKNEKPSEYIDVRVGDRAYYK